LDSRDIDRSNQVQVNSYADVIDVSKKAVVTVASERLVRRNTGGNPLDQFLRQLYGFPPQRNSGPQLEEKMVPYGMGSGVIVSSDGYILTNNHVVTDEQGYEADGIKITLADNREYDAEIVGRDPKTDIAVLKIEEENLPVIPMADSRNLRVGDIVFAIGNPMGLQQTVTMGIVSATGRSGLGLLGQEGYENFIQTDAAINMGNSGGALIDTEGRLVGINSAILSQSGGNIGLGFAIPVNMAQSILTGLVHDGEIRRGYLGIYLQDLDSDLAEAMHLTHSRGTLITDVAKDSPAEKVGLKRGDVILSLDGNAVDDSGELRVQIAELRPDTEVILGIWRDGKEIDLKATLGSGDHVATMTGEVLEGVTFSPNSADLQDRYNLSSGKGLVVTSVDASSPYRRILGEGMLLLEVNGQPVNSVDEATGALHKGANSLYLALRNGFYGYIGITVE